MAPEILPSGATGERPEAASRAEGRGSAEGVAGFKSLGVREMGYRTAFLACSVTSADARFGYALGRLRWGKRRADARARGDLISVRLV